MQKSVLEEIKQNGQRGVIYALTLGDPANTLWDTGKDRKGMLARAANVEKTE